MPKPQLTRKKILIVGTVIGLLIIGSIGAAMFMRQFSGNGNEEPVSILPVEDVRIAALDRADNNDIDGALKVYDDQIEARQDDDEKRSLLLYKASFAQQSGRFDVAVAATEQADEIASDAVSAEAMAMAFEASGDLEQALIYYKKALELSPKEGMGARYNPILEEKIERLEQ